MVVLLSRATSAREGTQSEQVNRGTTDITTALLDELLLAGRGERNLRGTGWLDQTEATWPYLARMERPFTRAKSLMQRGLEKPQALKSAMNGRGRGGMPAPRTCMLLS
jgi:hypothetical protein